MCACVCFNKTYVQIAALTQLSGNGSATPPSAGGFLQTERPTPYILQLNAHFFLLFFWRKKSFIIGNGTWKSASKYLTVQPAKQPWAHQSAAATAADSLDAVTGGELEAIWAHDPSSADRLTWAEGHWVEGLERQSVSHVADWWFFKEPLMSLALAATSYFFIFYFLSIVNVTQRQYVTLKVESAIFGISAVPGIFSMENMCFCWRLVFTDAPESLCLLWKPCSRHLETQGCLFLQSRSNPPPVHLCVFWRLTSRPHVLPKSDFLTKTVRVYTSALWWSLQESPKNLSSA